MHPFLFEIFGKKIASYGVLAVLGAFVAWAIVWLLAGKKNAEFSLAFLISICGAIVGSMALRPIMKLPGIIINWEHYRRMTVEMFLSYTFGEIVFYGGLIGGLVSLSLYCARFKLPILPFTDAFAPALALAHGIGRVGCFLAGCCYGVHVSSGHPFAVVYPLISQSAPAGVPLLAVQLIEAASLLALSALLILVYKKSRRTGLCTCIYILLYSIMRFILEFYRGDAVRGVYGPFSTSQYISMAMFLAVIVLVGTLRNKTSIRWLFGPPSSS